jgi:hypothetical protein
MKKIAISLLALAAVSTVALAGVNTGSELRETGAYSAANSSQLQGNTSNANAFAVDNDSQGSTSFERLKLISEQNDKGGRH